MAGLTVISQNDDNDKSQCIATTLSGAHHTCPFVDPSPYRSYQKYSL